MAKPFVFKNPETDKPISVTDVKYHRNGVAGNGFYVISFDWPYEDGKGLKFIGIVFPRRGDVAVISPEQLDQRWRGDNFEAELRECVKQYENWR